MFSSFRIKFRFESNQFLYLILSLKNLKHKRNSCIAVMNEFTLSTAAMAAAAAAASGASSTGAATSTPIFTQSQGLSMHDSTSSFHSYISSTPTSSTPTYGTISFSSNLSSLMSPGASPTDRGTGQRPNRIRRITNLSSIFANNSSTLSPSSAASVATGPLASQAKAKFVLNETLFSYSKELPPISEKLNLRPYDSSILEIESKWNVFVGDAFVQVKHLVFLREWYILWL